MLRDQATYWASKHLRTSGIAHRPPVLTGYVEWLVQEWQTLRRPPRAVSGKRLKAKIKYARAVAPWTPNPHRYNGPPKVLRSALCLRRSLLTEFPKEGDSTLRNRSLDASALGVVAAVEDREVLDPLTVSVSEVHRLAWMKPADAARFCERDAA